MALGRLAHYAIDAVLVSTVLAGVRRSSGFSCVILSLICFSNNLTVVSRPDLTSMSDSTFRGFAEKFLGVGESVFDMLQATAVNSSYFTKEKRPGS